MKNITVIKCGGSVIDSLSDQYFANIAALKKNGAKPIVVHGGGPAIAKMLGSLRLEFEFVDGLRKTTAPVMDVVEMVLSGSVNNALVRKLYEAEIKAVGLSGSDAGLLQAVPKDFQKYGYVGEVADVNISFLTQLLDAGIVPVIAPIAIGKDGSRYNVNADTAAGAIAKAVGSEKLIFITDVPGVMQDGVLLESVTEDEVEKLIEQGVIYGGMIPKVEAALGCLNGDLQEVMIASGNGTPKDDGFRGTVIRKTRIAMKS